MSFRNTKPQEGDQQSYGVQIKLPGGQRPGAIRSCGSAGAVLCPFPPIVGGQRALLRRLRENVLMLVSFITGSTFTSDTGPQFAEHVCSPRCAKTVAKHGLFQSRELFQPRTERQVIAVADGSP